MRPKPWSQRLEDYMTGELMIGFLAVEKRCSMAVVKKVVDRLHKAAAATSSELSLS